MVEGTGLENRRASNGTEGSNPSLSAMKNDEYLLVILHAWAVFVSEVRRLQRREALSLPLRH